MNQIICRLFDNMEGSNEGVQESISNVQLAKPRDMSNLLDEISFSVKGKKNQTQIYQDYFQFVTFIHQRYKKP